MNEHGFLRVAAAIPLTRLADPRANADHVLALLDRAEALKTHVVVFPELCLTGYSCGDLFHQAGLHQAALAALQRVAAHTATRFRGVAIVGLPWRVGDQLYNVAAVLQHGHVLGVVPKSYLPNYQEFYEARWFTPGRATLHSHIAWGDDVEVPFGTDLLFDGDDSLPGLMLGIEICEDLWVPVPPSSWQALAGATVLVNLSASNEVIGKPAYRRQLVSSQSGRCLAGYVYASCGTGESTTDVVYGGHAVIAEAGVILAESARFPRVGDMLVSDIDLARLRHDRVLNTSFSDSLGLLATRAWRRLPFTARDGAARLVRSIPAHPFIPKEKDQLRERCDDIFHTQVAGLCQRLDHVGKPRVVLGISGGLDSTLALLVTCKTFDRLGLPRNQITGLTMPGFGTTRRTLENAHALMKHLGIAARETDIRTLCFEELKALGHAPFGIALGTLTLDGFTQQLAALPPDRRHDLVFENVQARRRTSLLMNTGFVVGTGDLSELALGWCTYNGDHMSMYNPNVGIPKTLVKFLVRWAAENEFEGAARATLSDIVATVISPELLPTSVDGVAVQATEESVGPYELVDFFLYHVLRHGATPEKIRYLASHAEFDRTYSAETVEHWLSVFLHRFAANQFKRSCLPDGPKVGSVSLSPRGDWRMPSDARSVTGTPPSAKR